MQIKKILKKRNWKARFAFGGSTKYMVEMLEDGTLDYILDAQAFDLDAVKSISKNKNHQEVSIFHAYDYNSKGNYTTMMDIMILGATEIDVNFNGNVVTHSDGYLQHGIGGWQNCLNAKCTIIPVPLFRNRMPIIKDEVTGDCAKFTSLDGTNRVVLNQTCSSDKSSSLDKVLSPLSVDVLADNGSSTIEQTVTLNPPGVVNVVDVDFGGSEATPLVLYATNISASQVININQWYYVCGVFYGVGVVPKIYLNGIDKSSGGGPGNGVLIDDSSFNGRIGSDQTNIYDYNFNGYMDEVKIYPYARSADEIKRDYNAGLAGVSTSKGTSISFGTKSDSWMNEGLVG